MMNSHDLRKKFLDFFSKKEHQIISSASLIPENDPSLLFVNSGMSPLVPYLSGQKHPGGKRLVNSQKCFRAEDIDELGDGRHITFFEMLGNWSLADYFKEEQLSWWFEFLLEELGLDIKNIYQTVYKGNGHNIPKDYDSIKILTDIYAKYGLKVEEGPEPEKENKIKFDFSYQKIFAYQEENWWQRGDALGELGGPDSETFYDTGKEHDISFGPYCHPNCDCGRFIEIGNSVFMQYQKGEDGWQELKQKNVDFGGGLERILMIINQDYNIFKIDSLKNLILKLEEWSGKKYEEYSKYFEIISDHIRSASFLLGDDKRISPSNVDQGYIIRRLIRRALRSAKQIGLERAGFTADLSRLVIDFYQEEYPELLRNKDFIIQEMQEEEVKFSRLMERGERILNNLFKNNDKISGHIAFNLFQSHGYPLEMTEEIIKEKGLKKTDKFTEEYNLELKRHQELSKTSSAGKFKGGLADQEEATTKLHTAAHLLLEALRRVLGPQVEQRGSNITAERLRFDFSHHSKMTEEEKEAVEKMVNEMISQELEVDCREMSLEDAKAIGAIGVFESKYGEQVKVYSVGDFSKEICGGPHVQSLKGLGHFKIKKEESSSAGIRRIRAVLVYEKN